jgi:rhodanese-related sulfurtransferase
MNRINSLTRLVGIGLIALALTFSLGCSDDDDGGTGPTISEFDVIADAANGYLAAATATTTATALYNNINDGNAANDPFILDVRGATDYAAGHVAGAVNIPYREIAKAANQGLLPGDKSKEIVVICYTGHTASQTAAYLGTLGYANAKAMKFGMTSWTVDPVDFPWIVANPPYSSATDCGDYPVSTVNVTPGTHALPTVENTTSSDESEIIRAAADAYLSSGAAPTITAATLYNNLNDGNTANDPFILDVRSATDYAAGHVVGAINIGWKVIADPANLAKLPTDRQIVVICYTGHTASYANMVLKMLGYNAITMKYGMTSWTVDPAKNPSITTNRAYDVNVDCMDYPCVK